MKTMQLTPTTTFTERHNKEQTDQDKQWKTAAQALELLGFKISPMRDDNEPHQKGPVSYSHLCNGVHPTHDWEIYILLGTWTRNKYEVKGTYPYDLYRETKPTIGIGLIKTPEQIAKDISRRFLPAYIDLYNKAKTRKEENDTYESKKSALYQSVVTALDAFPSEYELSKYLCDNGTYESRVSVTVHSPESCEILIRGDAARTLKLIQVLKDNGLLTKE